MEQQGERIKVPWGFKFLPSDEELIGYLQEKINGKLENPDEICIPCTNVYKNHPQELTEAYPSLGINEWYFVTSRDRRYLKGSRPNRRTADGYWKATGSDKPIFENKVRIGSKRALVFYEIDPPNDKKTKWLMQEYMIDQSLKQHKCTNNDMLLDECVLCRIYMSSRGRTKVEEASSSCQTIKYRKSATKEHMQIGQHEGLSLGEQQQPNYLIQQQINFPTIQQHSHESQDQNQILGGQHNIIEQQPNYLMNFPIPPHECNHQPIDGHSLGITSDYTEQIYDMENLVNQILAEPPIDFNQILDRPADYYFGSSSDNTGQIYDMENVDINTFLMDPQCDAPLNCQSFGDCHLPQKNIDDFAAPCTLMESFEPLNQYDIDFFWEELSSSTKK